MKGRGEEIMKTLRIHKLKFFILCFAVWGLQGCSTHLPPAGVEAYNQCNYGKAIETFSKTKKKEKDGLLFDLAILSSAVHAGDAEEVKKVGLRAQQQMWNYEGAGKGTASLISSEAIRIYKGEPFEKSMASMYLGIVYFNEGDYENAKAAFTKAMFASQTKGENSEADFAAPLILLAKTYLKLKDQENANIVLKRLQKILPNQHLISLEKISQIKTIAFVELGKVASKIRVGPGDSLIGWQRQPYADRDAVLFIDGQNNDQIRMMDDLKYQAESVDRGGKKTIQATKGFLREASAVTAVIATNEAVKNKNETAGWVALGAGLFALADQSQADIRQWELLPDRLLLILSTEPATEGKHKFEVNFFTGPGGSQNQLSSVRQVWYDEKKADLDQIYIVRANSCSKNIKLKGNEL
jgi:tetratricopeptide (TPR) repeat protein